MLLCDHHRTPSVLICKPCAEELLELKKRNIYTYDPPTIKGLYIIQEKMGSDWRMPYTRFIHSFDVQKSDKTRYCGPFNILDPDDKND